MSKLRHRWALPLAAGALLTPAAQAAWVDTATKALPPVSSIPRSAVADSMPLHLIVSLQLRDQSGLNAFLKNQDTPGNPQYGIKLSADQFRAAYSPTAAQAQAVTAYLAQAGFSNIQVVGNRALVTADGTASMAQRAFNTQLVQYQINGQTFFSNVSAAQVPDTLGGTVLAVLGLQNVAQYVTHHQIAQRFDLPVPVGATAPAPVTNAGGNPTGATLTATYTAADFRRAYDADATPDGSGTTVAIISGGTDLVQVQADLQQAERDAGLPYVPVSVVQLETVPNPQATANDGEWDLDSQSASGMARNVKQIIFYNGASLGTGITLGSAQFVKDNKAQALNISIGGCEVIDSALGEMATADQAFKNAKAQGQTVFVSAGDAGAACGVAVNLAMPQSGVPQQVEYPASSPYVVAVGGTSLFLDSNGNYALETAWNATGGGNSLLEAAPDWQAQSGAVPGATTSPLGRRGVPDVAMNAGFNLSPAAGFYSAADTVVGGRHEGVIGTSLSSPLSMGVWARMQSAHCNSYGFAAPLFYALDTAGGPLSTATGFNDIVLGSNGGYAATPGWDYTTGFGTFDVKAVNNALPAHACPVNQAPTAALAASAQSGQAPLTVAFDGSGSSDPDGEQLAWYVVDFGDGSPVAFSQSAAVPHVYSAPGSYTASLTVRDAGGAVSAPVTLPISVSGTPLACVGTGVPAIANSAAPSLEAGVDPQNGNGSDFLRSVSIGEPGSLKNKLVFTMKVDSLATVPSPYRWVTYFTAPDGTLYYVSMNTNNGATSFTYGLHGFAPGAGASTFQQLGTLDPASNFKADGTITLVLDKAATGLVHPLKAGDKLTAISASVRLSIPDDPTGTVPAGAGLTLDGAGDPNPYVVVGNDTCDVGSGSSSSSSSGGGSSSSSSSSGGSSSGTSGGSSSSSGSSSGSSSSSSSSSGGSSGSSSSGGSSSSSGSGTQAPTASLQATPVSGTAPLAVNFDASASSDPNPGGSITRYAFDFGDGTTASQTAAKVSHTYSKPGSYSASVTVTDSEGGTAAASAVINAQSPQSDTPAASLAVSTTNGAAPLNVQFDASGSRDANGSITSYAFNFGDGSATVTQSLSTTSHTYTAAGTYQASVTVTNNFGRSSAAYVPITVSTTVVVTPPNGPVAELVVSPISGAAPLTVTLDGSHSFDSDSSAHITSYRFDFGDGSAPVTQTGATINHVYTAPGSYSPSLTVTDSNGQRSAAVIASTRVDPASTGSGGSSGSGSGGGGAFGGAALVPLMLGAALRRKRRKN